MAKVIDGILSEKRLAAIAGPASYAKAQDYVHRVRGLRAESGQAAASVQGKAVYRVSLEWGDGAISGTCDCPQHRDGNFCKHLVAVGLAVLDQTSPGPTRPGPSNPPGDSRSAVDRYLDSLDAQALRDLVVETAAYSQAALRMLEVRAASGQGDTEAVSQHLLEAVNQALSSRGFIDYRRSFGVARDANEALDELQRHLDEGAADAARPALLRALTRLRTITLQADDSGGVIGDACQRAADLYARACREGAPDPVKLARWLAKFRAESPGWPQTVLPDFVPAFDAKALATYRNAITKLDAQNVGEDRGGRFEIDAMLLELADHDGDVDRAVELLQRGARPEYCGIVARLQAAGRHRETMTWVDRAVAEDRVDATRSWGSYWLDAGAVARLYLDDGRGPDALAMLRRQFTLRPGGVTFALLTRHAEELGCADRERAWAFEHAREVASREGHGAVLVELALADGDLDAAWAAADAYGPGRQWPALAAASASAYPRKAADLYRPHLESELRIPNTKAYRRISQTLVRMRSLYAAAGAEAELDTEIRLLREEYRRRPALIAELDRAGLPR